MERLAATGRVRVLDLKAYYTGTPVDVVPDPELYRTIVELFPDVVIEDASLDGACGDALRGEEARLSFDAPIHSVADVQALAVQPDLAPAHWNRGFFTGVSLWAQRLRLAA